MMLTIFVGGFFSGIIFAVAISYFVLKDKLNDNKETSKEPTT